MTFLADWLALREHADAAARAAHLPRLLPTPSPRRQQVIRDLGCGTGAMGRWLAPRLPGPQRWILHDTDPELSTRAAAHLPHTTADGHALQAQTEPGDITALRASDLADTDLVTTSALLDLLTAEEVQRLAAACTAAGCPALFTLSVQGRVELAPPDPLDADVCAAFNAHQRRRTGGRRLLGPDAADVAAAAFRRRGVPLRRARSPWRLDATQTELIAQWLRGWVGAACQQCPALAPAGRAYLQRRLAQNRAGQVQVVVHHSDLLALPPPSTTRQ